MIRVNWTEKEKRESGESEYRQLFISLNLKRCQDKGQKLAKIQTLGRVYLRTI